MVDLLREYCIPGSFSFLILGISVGAVLIHLPGRAAARAGKLGLAALATLYWVLSMPVVSEWLATRSGREYRPLASVSDAGAVSAVVVLTGGSVTYRAGGLEINMPSAASAFRALETARVYRLLGDPLVVISGGISDAWRQMNIEGESIREVLLRNGVPLERIVMESTSRNTHEQALKVGPVLSAHRIDRFVLVTSPPHMWRALRTFQGAGLHPVPSVSVDRSEGLPLRRRRFLPTAAGLEESRWAIREYLAAGYYWSRGWLKTGEA